jgi:Methylamine utilisation protein MauE
MIYLMLGSRCLIGAVFAVSALSKPRSEAAFRAFREWLAALPVLPGPGRNAAAVALVGAESLVVLLVILPWTAVAGLLLAAVLLAGFAAASFGLARSRARVSCRCFGPSSAPLGLRHVLRDVLLAAAAAGAAAAGPGHARPAGIALAVGIAIVALTLVLFLDDLSSLFTEGIRS